MHWKMRVVTIYDDEREMIVTYEYNRVTRQSIKTEKGQMNSQVTITSYIEHTSTTHDKTTQTRTFQYIQES